MSEITERVLIDAVNERTAALRAEGRIRVARLKREIAAAVENKAVSLVEAMRYLKCGNKRLDRNGDGVPCERICKQGETK